MRLGKRLAALDPQRDAAGAPVVHGERLAYGLRQGVRGSAAGAEVRGTLPRVRRHSPRPRSVPGRQALHRRQCAPHHGVVLQRLPGHGPEPARAGRHARGPRHGRRRLRRHAQYLGHVALSRRAGARARRPARQGSRTAVHVGLCRQRHHARHPAEAAARLHPVLRRQEPRLHDRRHPQRRRPQADLAQQRPGRPRGQPEARAARCAQGDRLRIRLLDGRPDGADRRRSATSPRNTTR